MSIEELRKVGKFGVIEIPRKSVFRGSESKVYFGRFDSKEVAVKTVDEDDTLSKELELLRDCQHDNIVRCLFTDVDPDEDRIYIVLEKCQCTLREFVNDKKDEIPHRRILWQIVCGLDYLHSIKRIIHRDLKPCNVLMNFRDGQWLAKLSDFGISKKIDPTKTKITQTSIRGTIGYSAPETLRFEKIDMRADIFALGNIFYYVLSEGEHPFGMDNLRVEADIRDGKIEPNLAGLKPEFADEATSLILTMIAHNREDRLSITEVMAHHLFWDAEKKLHFIQEVSDYCIAIGNFETMSSMLEERQAEIVGDWRKTIYEVDPVVEEVFEKMRNKRQKNGVCDLLRNIRNLKSHYNEKPKNFHTIVGTMPDGMANFFTLRFPKLLSYVYEILRCCRQEFNFQKFYEFKSETTQSRGGASISVSDPWLTAYYEYSVPGEAIRPDSPEYIEDSDEELLCLDAENQCGPDAECQNDGVLNLREYQLELADQALAGHNSVIIAPTGSGKTAVANAIIRNHLQQQKAKSILFFVSKTTLAVQQHHFFFSNLGDLLKETEVAYLIGEISTNAPPVGSIMKEMKLTVLTPQILIDELKRSKSFLKFDDISMMIFDECHNAHNKHPYKVIMDMLYDRQNETLEHLPIQIIGMTASPGVGKAKDREQVMENLITLLANLNVIQCPAVVRKNKDELKKYQNNIEENYIRVTVDDDIFSKKILKAIQLIEDRIESFGILGSNAGQILHPPLDKTKQMYGHWVVQLINHVKLKIHDKEPSKQSLARKVVTYGEHLQMCYTLLYLTKHIPNAMDVTDSHASFDQNSDEERFLTKINQELHRASKDAAVPMLDKLIEELKKQFEQNRESRCIIFVPHKLIASELVKCIQTHSNLAYLQPEYLTGTNDQESVGGMTKNKQQSALEAFKAGRCKVLIVTSVAEEGLDIRACNLVIMYNYVTDEIGRIQRAGRGGAKNSKSILIAPCGSAQIERENMNAICARATACAIDDLNEMSANERVRRIRKVQLKHAKVRKLERDENDRRLQGAAKWQILCGKCQAMITTADQLRQIKNQHKFVIDPTFKSRVFKRHFNSEQREVAPGVIGIGEFRCGNPECRHYLGLEMQYMKKLYPTLTVKQLFFEDKNGERRTAKQWNKCPFEILSDMEDSDDENQEIDKDAIYEFAPRQSKLLGKGFEAEDLSKEDAMETLYLDNNF